MLDGADYITERFMKFNNLVKVQPQAPKLLNYITPYDINNLLEIVNSYTITDTVKKYKYIEDIMKYRNFKKMGCGTNRITFKHNVDPSIILKVAVDSVGMNDGSAEIRNKMLLGPFGTDIYDVSPCGTVGLFERVIPITNVDMFIPHAGEVFDLLMSIWSSGYVFKDVGNNSFMNYGIRPGFGAVLLDYPYFYKADPKKLTCKNIVNGKLCLGKLDYDKGFNRLYCPKCKREYLLNEVRDLNHNLGVQIKGSNKGEIDMKITIKLSNGKTYVRNTGKETENIIKDNGYDKYNIPTEEDLEFLSEPKDSSLVVNMKEILGYKDEVKVKKQPKYNTKSKFIPDKNKKSLNKHVEELVEEKEVIDDEAKAEITESILDQLKDSMTSDIEEQKDYSDYKEEVEEQEQVEEEIIEDDDEPETFEKIKKQDKSDVYDEY